MIIVNSDMTLSYNFEDYIHVIEMERWGGREEYSLKFKNNTESTTLYTSSSEGEVKEIFSMILSAYERNIFKVCRITNLINQNKILKDEKNRI